MRRRADRGSASGWVLAIGAVVLLVALGAQLYGGAVVARHRAQAAADLAALAGARLSADGADGGGAGACAAATRLAQLNAAALVTCTVDESAVTVAVQTAPGRLAGLTGLLGPARAVARAGPIVELPAAGS